MVWSARVLVVFVGALALASACGGDGDPQQRGSLDSFMHVHGVEAPTWAPGVLFLSTHEGLIRIAAGQGWEHVSDDRHDFMGFAAHPSEEGVLYSSGHPAPGSDLENPIGFMVSTDAGKTWSVRALHGAADFHAMTVGADGGVVYGWTGVGEPGLYRSTDGGHQWRRIASDDLERVGGPLVLAADPADVERLWAGTQAGLLRSDDAGRSWDAVIPDVPTTAVRVDPSDRLRLLAYVAPPGDGLMESSDGGATWTTLGWELEGDAVSHIAVDPSDGDRLFAGTFAASVYQSDDAGDTWEVLARAGRRVS